MSDGPPVPDFEVLSDAPDADTLLCGFSEFGLAGLTAVQYIVEHLELEEVGHVTAEQLPAITPFEDGTPRHHTRLFGGDGSDVTVLAGELLVPPHAAGPLAEAVLGWTDANGVAEVVVVSGVPVAHGPDDHRSPRGVRGRGLPALRGARPAAARAGGGTPIQRRGPDVHVTRLRPERRDGCGTGPRAPVPSPRVG